jgi:5'-3' exonuclease
MTFVLDGKSLVCKEKTMEKREEKRKKFLQKALKMESKNYDVGESSVYMKYSEKIKKETIYFFIDYLKHKNLDIIIAPYEADSQLYYLYKSKQIDYIMSEDSDIAAYGCTHIIKGLLKTGKCQILNDESIKEFKHKLNEDSEDYAKKVKAKLFFELKPEDKVNLCIYSGCDYLENIKGIGFGSLIDYFSTNSTKDLRKKITSAIERDKKFGILPAEINDSSEYFDRIDLVKEIFTNQVVYDGKGKFIHLSDQTIKKTRESKILEFIGDIKEFEKKIGNDIKSFVEGDYDTEDFSKREIQPYNYEKTIEFTKMKSNHSQGLLHNLSSKTFTFKGFCEDEEAENTLCRKKSRNDDFDSPDHKIKKKIKKT